MNRDLGLALLGGGVVAIAVLLYAIYQAVDAPARESRERIEQIKPFK